MNGLRKKLKDSIESFNNLRQQISSEYREIVQRRYFTVTGKNPDDKTVDLLISTGHLLFQTLFEFSVEIFRRFHWEFSKGFMCVVWLGFLLVLFYFIFFFGGFYWFCKRLLLLVLLMPVTKSWASPWLRFHYRYRVLRWRTQRREGERK